MAMTVSIDPQEKWVWWAVSDGWMKKAGMTCEVDDLNCSAVFMKTDFGVVLVISELTSGIMVYKFPISTVEIIMSGTKERTIELTKEKLELLLEMLSENEISADDITNETNTKLAEYTKKFGPMPPIEIMEDFK